MTENNIRAQSFYKKKLKNTPQNRRKRNAHLYRMKLLNTVFHQKEPHQLLNITFQTWNYQSNIAVSGSTWLKHFITSSFNLLCSTSLFVYTCLWLLTVFCTFISSHLSPLTSEVVGAPQMTLQQYLSILPCLPLPSGNLQTPFLSIPWCYLPISSSVFLSFLLLSLSPAELSSPCQRILRCGHTPSEFPFPYHGQEIIMHSNCILDSVANLLRLLTVFSRYPDFMLSFFLNFFK